MQARYSDNSWKIAWVEYPIEPFLVREPVCSAKTSWFWVFACFSYRHLFQSIFVMQTAEDRAPYHSVTTRNSVT